MNVPQTTHPLTFPELRGYRMGLDCRSLASELRKLVAARRRGLWLVCRYLSDLADFDDGGGLQALRYDSIHDFAWRQLAMTRDQTNRRLRVGRALRELPAIEEAFVVGRIGFARTREIVKVATAETEAYWLGLALELPRRELERRVARARHARPEQPSLEAAGADEEEPRVRLEVPLRVWRRLEAAIEVARTAEGAPLGEDEALEVIAESAIARLDAQSRCPTPAPHGAGQAPAAAATATDDAPHGAGPAGPVTTGAGTVETPAAAGRLGGLGGGVRPTGRSLPMGGARDGGGDSRGVAGPLWEEAPPAPEGISTEARRIWEVLPRQTVWGGDQLADATGLSGQQTAAALGELETYGHLDKVAGGWRQVIRRQDGDG